MSSKMIELGIDKLSIEERCELLDEIKESLNESAIPPLTEEQKVLFLQRRAQMKANPEMALTWEELKDYVSKPIIISDELWAELERRDAEMDAHPENNLTWEQIRANVEARLKAQC